MKIQYLGHSAFLLTESTGTRILADPFTDIGYEMPSVDADIITVSHKHYDHSAVSKVGGSPIILDGEGLYEMDGIDIVGIKSFHDANSGDDRGENIIFKYRMDGLDICHLGDIGEELTLDLLEQLLPVDILLIPVGGKYTIDSKQAKNFVDQIMPDIVIPMHYKTKSLTIEIDKVNEFIDLFDEEVVHISAESQREFSREDIEGEYTKVIVMKRKKQ